MLLIRFFCNCQQRRLQKFLWIFMDVQSSRIPPHQTSPCQLSRFNPPVQCERHEWESIVICFIIPRYRPFSGVVYPTISPGLYHAFSFLLLLTHLPTLAIFPHPGGVQGKRHETRCGSCCMHACWPIGRPDLEVSV